MKTKYKVQRIDWNKVKTPEDYEKAIQNGEHKICYGLQEVFAYCGGKLKRSGWGYAGCYGNIGYIATRA